MNEAIQIVLIVVISILTSLIIVVTFQVINILKELRKSIQKMNEILGDVEMVSDSLAKPVSSLSGLLTGIKNGLELFSFFKKKKEKEEKK